MIEVRHSRVSGDYSRIAVSCVFFEKGDFAEGFCAGSGSGFWDDAEYAAYCHVRGALSVLSAIWFLNLHHKRVSLRGTVVCGVFASNVFTKRKEERKSCI